MALKRLFDTNAYTAWKRGHPSAVDAVRSCEEIIFSSVVAGELLFGFRNGTRYDKNWGELQEFLSSPYVNFLAVTMTTADRFGRIAAALRKKGTPIPTNDIWIAAHAMESGAELVSFDRHFEHVDGLALLRLV